MATQSRNYAQLLWRYLRPHWPKALILMAVMLVTIGLQLVNPQIVRGFIDAAQAQADLRQLVYAALTFLGIGITVQVLRVVTTYLSTDVGLRTTNALRADLAAHCLNLSMSFHNEHTPGEMIERIDGDVTALANFFSQLVIRLLGSGLLIAGTLALLFREDWRVGLALTVFAGVSLAVLLSLSQVAVADSEAERQASAQMFGFLEERVSGLDDIRANGMGAYTMRRFYERIREYYQTGRRAFKKRTVIWRTTMALFGQGQVLALGIGAYLFLRHDITLGTVYLLYHYTEMLFDPLETIAQQIQDLQKAAAGITRIRALLANRTVVADGHSDALPQGALGLRFDDVTFRYGEGEPVLHNVSFELAPGTTLGLLGRTGSGKTTLTRLLFRLYEPTQGLIHLGGRALPELKLGCLRQRVAMVTQEVQIFQASVRDNLTFFGAEVDDQRIMATLYELGLGAWYERLPKGLDTELASGGAGLSAGEAQLLAFARAFLGDPGLVVLDEPSSRLDPATEHLLEQAMNRLLKGRTGIIIAHRLATVQRVNEIMIMGQGRVQEHGRREELVHDPTSEFYQLLTTGLEEAIA
jgi:ATP-binding cassette, subfamily B, bacterial